MRDTEHKTETLNLRVSPQLKTALQSAAKQECRSMANMVEFLVLRYCREHGLIAGEPPASYAMSAIGIYRPDEDRHIPAT